MTCSPELLQQLKIKLDTWHGEDEGDSDVQRRMHALLPWLLRHSGSLRELELAVNVPAHTSPGAALLDGCISAAGHDAALQRLVVQSPRPWPTSPEPYILGCWAQSLSSLRHLSLTCWRPLWLPPTLEGLSQLQSLSLEAADFKFSSAASPLLPPSLTKLHLAQYGDAEQRIQAPLQVGRRMHALQSLGAAHDTACRVLERITQRAAAQQSEEDGVRGSICLDSCAHLPSSADRGADQLGHIGT